MDHRKLRVCIVGAGVSGITALKEVLEEGHSAVCLERERVPGGVFTTGVSYESMRLTVSQYWMAYSAFPPPLEDRRQWTRGEYIDYLARYRARYDLDRHIRLECAVESVTREADGSFVVAYTRAGELVREHFDAVAVCRGAWRADSPRMPALEGAETFTGELLHSSAYKSPEPFRGKRVVCIGLGETAADITRQVAEVASSCHVSIRSYPLLIQRKPFGLSETNDANTNRILGWAPRPLVGRHYGALVQKDFESDDPIRHFVADWFMKAGFGGRPLQKNDDFVASVLAGKIQVIPHAVTRLEGNRVCFADGGHVEADVVICCTGYEESAIPAGWIEGLEVPDVRRLYKHAFHPDFGPRLAFLGWARPYNGGVPCCSEMLARYFALLCSGKREMPTGEELVRRIEEDVAIEEEQFSNAKNIRTLVDYNYFVDSVAELVGCAPDVTDFLDDAPLLYKLLCGSAVPATYRLQGPGADPAMAREVILRLPVARRSVDLALLPPALEGRVEASLIPKICAVVEQHFAADTQLV